MNGSVMPLVGIRSRFTATLMKACLPTSTNSPAAATCSNGSDSLIALIEAAQRPGT